MGVRIEALRAGGLTAGARRLATACARGLRIRQAMAAQRWQRALPSEPGPSASQGPRVSSLMAHADPGNCLSVGAPAPIGTCALTVDDRCLAQGNLII